MNVLCLPNVDGRRIAAEVANAASYLRWSPSARRNFARLLVLGLLDDPKPDDRFSEAAATHE